jgi:hypothetical protein
MNSSGASLFIIFKMGDNGEIVSFTINNLKQNEEFEKIE